MSPVSIFGLDSQNNALLSPCRTWRYVLQRRWGSGPFVLFVGLNPSTADESVDDPTIRRCVGFAKRWRIGGLPVGGLLMGNLFAYRSTYPKALRTVEDPVGPDNDVWLTTMAVRSALVIAAWGADDFAVDRAKEVSSLLGEMKALRITKTGAPGHPVRLPNALEPIAWSLS